MMKKFSHWIRMSIRPCQLMMGLELVMCLYLSRNAGLDDRVLTPAAAGPSHWSVDASSRPVIGPFEYYLVSHWT